MRTLGALDERGRYGLATDLYELTMGAAYFEAGMAQAVRTFELFVPNLPPSRGFLLLARPEGVIEFGARRAHGFHAALFGARAALIGGCIGTSNTLAGQTFDVPVYGTAAHSFTMAFAREADAFRAFVRTFPEHAILLIDTYDTLEGARRAAALGPAVRGVRLDSGDLPALSRAVRAMLDAAGLQRALIVASGDLNEERIAALSAAGAPVDPHGRGTDLATSPG